MVCNTCKKEFNFNEVVVRYGFKNGKPFSLCICKECLELLSEDEIENLIYKSMEVKNGF